MHGDNVIVAAPEGFIDVVDGTSFSAPLMARFLSFNIKAGTKYTGTLDLLDQSSDSK